MNTFPRLFQWTVKELSLPTMSPLPTSPQKSKIPASKPIQIHKLQGDHVAFYPEDSPTVLSWTRWRSASGRILLEPMIYHMTDEMKEMSAALNVRDSPNVSGNIVGRCQPDAIFIPVNIQGDWVRCHLPKDIEPQEEQPDLVWVLTQQNGMTLLDSSGKPDDMDEIFLATAVAAAEEAAKAAAEEEFEVAASARELEAQLLSGEKGVADVAGDNAGLIHAVDRVEEVEVGARATGNENARSDANEVKVAGGGAGIMTTSSHPDKSATPKKIKETSSGKTPRSRRTTSGVEDEVQNGYGTNCSGGQLQEMKEVMKKVMKEKKEEKEEKQDEEEEEDCRGRTSPAVSRSHSWDERPISPLHDANNFHQGE